MRSPEGRGGDVRGEPSYAAAFAHALLDPDLAAPGVVAGPKSKAAAKRYNVYRNNVTVSLINALAAAFPATLRITGDDFFRAMARSYVRAAPPTSPLLFDYGQGFPDFIEQYEFAQSVPWLADVARIERAWLDAYHAADIQPLEPHDLAAVPLDRLTNAVLQTHPSTRVIRSRFSAVTVFTASRSDGPARQLEVVEPEDALLTRPALEVEVRQLPPGGAIFLSSLMTGESLGVAASAAFAESPSFDLSANIRGLLEAGAFTTILCAES
jgi:Putative DNA-binding domain